MKKIIVSKATCSIILACDGSHLEIDFTSEGMQLRKTFYLQLEIVWDMLRDHLATIEPGDNPGLDRRQVEAIAAKVGGATFAQRKGGDSSDS